MTQATDIDIRELKDLILGLDKKIEAIDRKVDAGFANTDLKFTKLDGRIDTLETRVLGKFDTVSLKALD
jgi:hypothetical protein